MDFYPIDEETPLMVMPPSPQRSETDVAPSPHFFSSSASTQSHQSFGNSSRGSTSTSRGSTSTSRGSTSTSRGSTSLNPNSQQTEFQLSVDKVSFIYSPKTSCTNGNGDTYSTFHNSLTGNHNNDDELSILDPYFDVTKSRLRMAFDDASPDETTDLLTYSSFRAALENMGIRCTDDAAFLKLVASIDRQAIERVSFAQFDAAVHKLKLVHLFDDHTVRRMVPPGYVGASMTVSDFSSTRLSQFNVPRHEVSTFFTSKRPSWVSARWINLNGRDSLNLKRLAIKYRLHPLAIEDTLEMHERPKFDRYDGHLFLVFPVLRMEVLQGKSFPVVKKRLRSRSISNLLKPETMGSSSGSSNNNSGTSNGLGTSGSFRKINDTENAEDPFKLWIEHVAIFIVGNNTVITVKDGDLSNTWQELNRRLNVPYSKLRHNDAKFLVYAVLDVIVDQVTNVIDSITESLMELENELEREKQRFDIGRLRFLKNELFRLPRLLKPAREVLKNLIESRDFDDAVTAYIRDVHDHVVQVLDDIELQLQMCRLLTEDYRDAKANQMNQVIYSLTIVTTVFLPAQFLTGVYGMNFDNMPELHERYGYALFWLLVLLIAVGLQYYFRHKKWI